MRLTLASIGLLSIVNMSHLAAADDPVLLGLDNCRMQLSSGIFRVSGTTVETQGNDTRTLKEECYVAFDYNLGCLRFERKGKGAFLLTPHSAYELWPQLPGDNESSITRRPVDFQTSRVNPFDIRNLGFFTCLGTHYRNRYKSFREYLLEKTEVLGTSREGSLTKIVFAHKDSQQGTADGYVTYKIWVDEAKGHTTTRIEANDFQVCDILWRELGGVQIPVSYRQAYKSKNSGLSVDVKWALDWQSVNQPVPKDMFDYHTLKRKDGHGVLYSAEVAADGSPIALEHFGNK